MKNLLVFYEASGNIKAEKMSAAEAIRLGCFHDVKILKIVNIIHRL
jgi:hypothetical protein